MPLTVIIDQSFKFVIERHRCLVPLCHPGPLGRNDAGSEVTGCDPFWLGEEVSLNNRRPPTTNEGPARNERVSAHD